MNLKLTTKLLAGALILSGAAFADTVFTLDPVGGAISGYAGETDIGWGFTLFNNDNYAEVTSAAYVSGTTLGTFFDYISTDQFIVVGPSPEEETVSQTFDSTLLTGVGQFVIDDGALVGAHSDGQIILTYDLYSVSPNDPSFDSGTDLVSSGNTVNVTASVDVVAAPVSTVPEPGSLALGLAGLFCAAGVGVWRKMRAVRPSI